MWPSHGRQRRCSSLTDTHLSIPETDDRILEAARLGEVGRLLHARIGENVMQAREENKQSPVRLLLTMEEAAQSLSLSVRFVYNLFYKNQIPTIKIGRSRRVLVADLQAFIERQAKLN